MSFEFHNGGKMPDDANLISVKIKGRTPHISSIEKMHDKEGRSVATQTVYAEGEELIEFFQKNGSKITLYTDPHENLQIQYSYDQNGDLLERVDVYKGTVYKRTGLELGTL